MQEPSEVVKPSDPGGKHILPFVHHFVHAGKFDLFCMGILDLLFCDMARNTVLAAEHKQKPALERVQRPGCRGTRRNANLARRRKINAVKPAVCCSDLILRSYMLFHDLLFRPYGFSSELLFGYRVSAKRVERLYKTCRE